MKNIKRHIALLIILAAASAGAFVFSKEENRFPHKVHIEQKLECTYCHKKINESTTTTGGKEIPPREICAECHDEGYSKAMKFRSLCVAALATAFVATTFSATFAAQPQELLLWPEGAPGALGEEPKDKPKLIAYLPDADKATGAAIVVCPGGGYGGLAMDHEGHQIAAWLNSFGVAAFICDYRHRGKGYGHPAPLSDAQRAIRLVRSRAAEYGLDPARIGIMGFSAGGHLAGTVATQPAHPARLVQDDLDPIGAHADFAVLIYPVVSLVAPWSHFGSRDNLLGTPHDETLARRLSLENAVTAQTPPMFITHEQLDTVVPVANSLALYSALTAHQVPATLLVTEGDVHGNGLGANLPWGQALLAWLAGKR